MCRPALRPALLVVLPLLAACSPPRERVAGRSPDGRTTVDLEVQPAAGDSVLGTGTLRVAGQPRRVILRGTWNGQDNGLRRLHATLVSDTMPGEHWSLEWSPVSLDGSLVPAGDHHAVALATLD